MTPEERRRHKDAEYRRRRKYLTYKGIPTSLIPAHQAAEHALKLYNLGWSYNAIQDLTNGAVASETIRNLTENRYPTISRTTHNAVTQIPYTLAPTPNVRDQAMIPTEAAARRVRALLRLGWTHADLNTRGIVTRPLVPTIYKQMQTWKWRRVAAVYDELSMTPGPSTLTASRSATRGYIAPLAWDDIDDPDETPTDWAYRERKRINGTTANAEPPDPVVIARILNGEWHLPATPTERIEVIRAWVEDGGAVNQLARQTGWKVERYLTASRIREEGDAA